MCGHIGGLFQVRCLKCDYLLRGLSADGMCPECGAALAETYDRFSTIPYEHFVNYRDRVCRVAFVLKVMLAAYVAITCAAASILLLRNELLAIPYAAPIGVALRMVVAVLNIAGIVLVARAIYHISPSGVTKYVSIVFVAWTIVHPILRSSHIEGSMVEVSSVSGALLFGLYARQVLSSVGLGMAGFDSQLARSLAVNSAVAPVVMAVAVSVRFTQATPGPVSMLTLASIVVFVGLASMTNKSAHALSDWASSRMS